MTNHEMLTIVQNQLAINLNCTVADINEEKDNFVFVEAKENPGRMPYPREKQHFDIMTMGKSIIVSATPARLKYAKEQSPYNSLPITPKPIIITSYIVISLCNIVSKKGYRFTLILECIIDNTYLSIYNIIS